MTELEEIVYEECPLDEMEYDSSGDMFVFLCPCGDLFQITSKELREGNRIARCPSCSLQLKVLIDDDQLEGVMASMKE